MSSSSSWRGRAVLIGAVFVLLPIIACQVILGIDHDLTTANVAEPDTAGPVAVTRCRYGVAPPGPPDAADGTEVSTLVFAIHYQNYSGRTEAGAVVGYDLDGVCTCDPRDDSTNGGRRSCEPKRDSGGDGCDRDGGIDNALEPLGQLVVPFSVPVEGDIDDQHACGSGGFLVVLSGYNGTANDPEVSVGVLVSYGIRDQHDVGGELDASQCEVQALDAGPTYPAKHDGTDKWSVRAADRINDSLKTLFKGYVTDYRLVLDSRFTGTTFETVVLTSRLSLSTPVLTAKLVPTGNGGFRLSEGLITGRAPVNDVLTSVASLRLPNAAAPDAGSQLCESPVFGTVRQLLCDAVDTVKLAERDFREDPCNAISVTFQFEAEPAQLGRTYDPANVLSGCATTFPKCP